VNSLYLYQVCSITAEGGRACSNLSGINGPSAVTATAAAGKVDITWADNSINEKGFNIWRKTGTDGPWWLIGRTDAGVNTYQDRAVEAGEYSYRICTQGLYICGASGKATVSAPGVR
jgi:hypothetical protein